MLGAGGNSAMSLTESFSDTGLLSLKYQREVLGKSADIQSCLPLQCLSGLLWSISCSLSISAAKKGKFHQFWCFFELKISFLCVFLKDASVATV